MRQFSAVRSSHLCSICLWVTLGFRPFGLNSKSHTFILTPPCPCYPAYPSDLISPFFPLWLYHLYDERFANPPRYPSSSLTPLSPLFAARDTRCRRSALFLVSPERFSLTSVRLASLFSLYIHCSFDFYLHTIQLFYWYFLRNTLHLPNFTSDITRLTAHEHQRKQAFTGLGWAF